MRRSLTVLLLAVLAIPVLPDRIDGPAAGVPAALADDDGPGFRIPKFRMIRPPRLPRMPQVRQARPQRAAPVVVAAERDARPGEIVIGEVSSDILLLILADGFTLIASSPTQNIGGVVARLRPPAGVSIEAARERVRAIAPAALVEPNHLYRPVSMPCRDGECAAFALIGWTAEAGACRAPVTIGMVDTSVNRDHASLRGRSIEAFPVLGPDDRPSSTVHGTAIAALLAGAERSPTPGLLPEARLVAAEAFHRDGAGDAADVYNIVRAIDELSERGVRVVNLSFAGPANEVLKRAVDAAASRGTILVAAAGNEGPNADPAYPAAYPGVVAVTAVDKDGKVYRQAGRGDHIAFAAPGVQLWTAASVSGGRYRSGTSYATPFVSAAYAAAVAASPDIARDAITDSLAGGAADLGDAGRDPVFGFGLIKAPPCPAGAAG